LSVAPYYYRAYVTLSNQVVPVNLLIDTGESDALWLFLIPHPFKKRRSIR